MTAREKAEQLRQEAIQGLLTERQTIDDMLATLGYGHEAQAPTTIKRRGRPPKSEGLAQQPRGDRDSTEMTSA
jgi:hypothetical protein